MAVGAQSHAEGSSSHANGQYSHAEGCESHAGAVASHAEGDHTVIGVNGECAHAEGDHTVADNVGEHAEGRFNKTNAGYTIHSVGIGTSMNDRKNAFEIMNNGDAYLIGVGNYDGTNFEESNTVQEILNNN